MTDRHGVPPAAGPDDAPRRDEVAEIDLLAYVDGILESDPARREAVRRHLADTPGDAARVADFVAQNEAIRRLGAEWLAAPVPARLLDTVYADQGGFWRRPGPRRAAVAALMMIAAVGGAAGGWIAAAGSPHDDTLGAFARSALLDHGQLPEAGPEVGRTGVARTGVARTGVASHGHAPLNWLTRRIAVRVEVPDLGAHGYTLIGQRRIVLDGDEPAVRLGYRHSDGSLVNIYLRPRWEDRPAAVMRGNAGAATVLRWLDGPLAVAMTASGAGAAGTVDDLVPTVRSAIAGASVAGQRAGWPISHDALLLDRSPPGPDGPAGTGAIDARKPSVRVN